MAVDLAWTVTIRQDPYSCGTAPDLIRTLCCKNVTGFAFKPGHPGLRVPLLGQIIQLL